LLAGIDLYVGHILGLVCGHHRSREFFEFLSMADNHYPADWRLRIFLDNHFSHMSYLQRKDCLAQNQTQSVRICYTPKHGSWTNLIEVFFGKVSRESLRLFRVESKMELKGKIVKYLEEVHLAPVVFKWPYKLDEVTV